MTHVAKIAVIGGSGLYEIEGLEDVEIHHVDTPFGPPSGPIRVGTLAGRRVAFLPRHGEGHVFNPSAVPVQANIWALKSLGVFWVISISAVGSLRLEIEPRHFVIPDQLIDRTRGRVRTLFEELAVHVGFSYPFHPMLADVLYRSAKEEQLTVHEGGTYVCMEGPQFSTKAESELYRSWGASVIGMTATPEAKLAREAEMCYATVALATDYDVWNEDDYVDVEKILANIRENITNVKRLLTRAVPMIPLEKEAECDASSALAGALLTDPTRISPATREKLGLLLDKYLESDG